VAGVPLEELLALVDRHRGPLLAFCARLLGSREEPDHVVQRDVPVAYREISRAESPRARVRGRMGSRREGAGCGTRPFPAF
jgi:DNA-directed RNA polymerase specialized sigma24 family protein